MTRADYVKLLSRKLSGELSGHDLERFSEATETNKEYKQLAEELSVYFENSAANPVTGKSPDQIWAKISDAENSAFESPFEYTSPPGPYANLLKIAAVLVVFLTIGWLGYRLLVPQDETRFDVVASTDQRAFRILADGTRVWLNKNSSLSFNQDFGKQKREMILTGEAYFDVTKNKKVPLFIHAGQLKIEVKGTAFNVNAYADQPEIKVALIRGSIEIGDQQHQLPNVLLRPNEKYIFKKLAGKSLFNVVSTTPLLILSEVKWFSDSLVFRNEKLKVLAGKMEVKYGLKIEIKSDRLKEIRFSGTFKTETIQQALEALKVSYPLTYTINNRVVVIQD